MATDNDGERLAFREAGRAVISWVLGAEVRDISIKPEEANLKWFEAGYFLNENDTKILEQGSPSNQDLERYKNQLMVWQAGYLAELMAFPGTQPERPKEFDYETELVIRIIHEQTQQFVGKPGVTASLKVRYRNITPIGEPLRLTAWIHEDRGRRVTARASHKEVTFRK